MMVSSPLVASAVGEESPPSTLAPVLITEVQTRSTTSAYEEFIELHNTTDQSIDFDTGRWQIMAAGKDAINWDSPTVSLALTGSLLPGESFVIGSIRSGVVYPQDATLWFAAGLADDGGHVRLVYNALAEGLDNGCVPVPTAVDQVEWSRKTSGVATYPSIDARNMFLTPTTAGITSGNSLQRILTQAAVYGDRNDDAMDFVMTAPTTGVESIVSEIADPGIAAQLPVQLPEDTCSNEEPEEPPAVPETPLSDEESPPFEEAPIEPEQEEETTPQPTIPAGNIGLKAPMLSEFLPNPASPQTDADDEFIELYNSNDAYFDLSGYVLEVGLTTKRSYTIPSGTKIPPRTFLAFFSAQTNLALSNSGSQVALVDPLGRTLVQSEAYGTAKDGQAWVFAGGIWQWTTKPTPNATNVVSTPVVKSKSTAKKSTMVATTSANKPGTTTTISGSSSEEDIKNDAVLAAATSTPLHPGVLALVAVFAVLYGAYEYRRDVANRIYQFRTNRATRRALREGAEGR